MKMVLADLAGKCFDENIELGEYDEMTERIRRRVLARIMNDGRRKRYTARRIRGITLIAAVLISLLTGTAYALGLFRMNKNHIPEDVTVHGEWIERDEDGNVTEIQDMRYPETNLTFTFECDELPHKVQFKPGWVPMDGFGFGEDGWYHYYGNDGDSSEAQIPYKIEIFYAKPGFQLVMMYESEILEESSWGEYEVTELVNHNPVWGDDNYVLLFSPDQGYMIRVGGGLDMETMEKIAKNLEVRTLDEQIQYDPDYNIGVLNVGRG